MKKLILIAALCAAFSPIQAHFKYRVKAIGPPMSEELAFYPHRLNNRGLVAGYDGGAGNPTAVRWNGRSTEDLLLPMGHDYAMALGLNIYGYAVGFSSPPDGNRGVALLWRPDGQFEEIAPGRANAISDTGVVVGQTGRFAFRWTQKNGLEMLGSNSDPWIESRARAINDAGQIVGYGITRGDHGVQIYHPLLWETDGAVRDLGSVGEYGFAARDINNRGEVIGDIGRYGGSAAGFFWTQQLGIREILPLPGHNRIYVDGISDSGIVVGTSQSVTGSYRAISWTKGGGTVDLNERRDELSQGWHLSWAVDINKSGQITGVGYLNGVASTYLATPTH